MLAPGTGGLGEAFLVWDGARYRPQPYDFFRDQDPARETPGCAERLKASADRTPAIIEAALDRATPCPIARAAVDAFLTILAAEAANLALKVLALGGIYIGGGIPPRLLPILDERAFMNTFCAKGRFATLLAQIPVHVVVNPDATLMGIAAYGWARMRGEISGCATRVS